MNYTSVPQIFEVIDETRARLYRRVEGLSEEQANFRPSEDKWSAALIVEHLAKTEANLVRVVAKLLRKAEAENVPSDGTINPPVSFATQVEKIQGARLEAPAFSAPEGLMGVADSLKLLSESRAALKELRPRLAAVDGSNVSYPHPFFGPLNLYEWLGFIGLHEMHHLRQIENVLSRQ
jgi:hypothetical protein